jgi:hypothetical protein
MRRYTQEGSMLHSVRHDSLRSNVTVACSAGMLLRNETFYGIFVCECMILVTEPIVCDDSFAQFINCVTEQRPVSSMQ